MAEARRSIRQFRIVPTVTANPLHTFLNIGLLLGGLIILWWVHTESAFHSLTPRQKFADAVMRSVEQQAMRELTIAESKGVLLAPAEKTYEAKWQKLEQVETSLKKSSEPDSTLAAQVFNPNGQYHDISNILQFIGWACFTWGLIQLAGKEFPDLVDKVKKLFPGSEIVVPGILTGVLAVGATSAGPLAPASASTAHATMYTPSNADAPVASVAASSELDNLLLQLAQAQAELKQANDETALAKKQLSAYQDCLQGIATAECATLPRLQAEFLAHAQSQLHQDAEQLQRVVDQRLSNALTTITNKEKADREAHLAVLGEVNGHLTTLQQEALKHDEILAINNPSDEKTLEGRLRHDSEAVRRLADKVAVHQLINRWADLTGGDPSRFDQKQLATNDQVEMAHGELDALVRFRQAHGFLTRVSFWLSPPVPETCVHDKFPADIRACLDFLPLSVSPQPEARLKTPPDNAG